MRTLLTTLLFNIRLVAGLLPVVVFLAATSAQTQPDLRNDLTIPPPAVVVGETNNPMPDKTRVEEARRDVRKLYAKELSGGTAQARAALAARLIEDAPTSGVLAVEYAMYLEAIDMAMSASHGPGALAAVDAIDRRFAVSPREIHALRGGVIARLAGKAEGRDQVKSILDAGKALVESLIEEELFADAFQRTGTLRQLVRKLRNTIYEYHYDADLQRWQNLQTAWRRARPMMLRLQDAPDDPAANAMAGRFYCLELGQWDRGLPMLAKGDNATLKNLATADLANPEDVDNRVAVGDGWYELAFNRRNGDNAYARVRALTWYRLAEPELRGVQKLDVANKLKRLSEYQTVAEVEERLTAAQASKLVRYREKLFLANRIPLTVEAAQTWCLSKGGNLACIRDRVENRLVARIVAEGLDPTETYKYWLGGTRAGGTGWRWTDGSALQYTEWYEDQPNNVGGKQEYIGIYLPFGQWVDEEKTKEHPFVAQWKVDR